MKKIEAIIKPFKLDNVKDALKCIGINGMTVLEVKGFGRQGGHKEIYRGSEYQVDYVIKIMVICYINDELVPRAIEAIRESAYTGNLGDGKIAVFDMEEIIRVRTGEKNIDAI